MIDNIAVYIDADNASYKNFKNVYKEVKKYGRIIIGRIYGDWTRNEIKNWKNISINYAFESQNCFNLSGKNSTDIYLICDLLKDLYKNSNIDTYIIVSSDSDYSHVTKIIKSEGKKIYGIGSKNTPKRLKNGCDIFICNENLVNYKKEENLYSDEDCLSLSLMSLSENDESSDIFFDDLYTINKEEIIFIEKILKEKKKISMKQLKLNLERICEPIKIFGNDFKFNFDIYLQQEEFKNVLKLKKCKKTNKFYIYYIKDILDTIDELFENCMEEKIIISLIKDKQLQKDSTFDQRNYGFTSMKEFIKTVFIDELKIVDNNYIKKI